MGIRSWPGIASWLPPSVTKFRCVLSLFSEIDFPAARVLRLALILS